MNLCQANFACYSRGYLTTLIKFVGIANLWIPIAVLLGCRPDWVSHGLQSLPFAAQVRLDVTQLQELMKI